MKPFRFPLLAILTLREEREQERQRQYADRLRAVESVQRALAAVQTELAALAAEHATRLGQGAQAQDLRRLDQYRHVLDGRLSRLHQDLAAARRAADAAWQALLKATQDRQALEKYQERLRRAHAHAVTREEQRLLDDLAGRVPTLAAAWRQTAEELSP